MGDARAWLFWALTLLVAASYNRNPLNSVVLLLIAVWVNARIAERARRPGMVSLLRLLPVIVTLSALLNALATRVGETVLLRMPAWLPLLGGPITLEAFVYGAINGLSLATILSAFAAFNRAMSVRDLMRLMPRAFHELGVVMSVALTFVPQTTRSIRRIREAQAIRGHRLRGIRDWLPVVSPLLVSALERAFLLAESMMARGYASVAAAPLGSIRALLTSGLLVLLGGWLAFALLPPVQRPAGAAMAVGVALLGSALWLTGRLRHHTVYRSRTWRAQDTLVVAGCLPAVALLVLQRHRFFYSPYPRLTLPEFGPLVGLALLGLATPAVLPSPPTERRCDDTR